MAEDRLIARARAISNQADARFGEDAYYRTTPAETGTLVRVRSMPLDVREASELTRAGHTKVSARWIMQTKYRSDVRVGHIISLVSSGFLYEVLDKPTAAADQLGIEWIIYTMRMHQ